MEMRQEYIEAIRRLAEAIYTKWGTVATYDGSVSRGTACWIINMRGESISIEDGVAYQGNRYAHFDAIQRAARSLLAQAQFLSSRDWLDRLEGSIKTLKAVTRALKE